MGRYVAPVCNSGALIGRRWSWWGKADDRKAWMRTGKDGEEDVVMDFLEA